MIAFFLSKKFWLPILILAGLTLGLELTFRSQVYDPMLNPNSHLGNSVNRIKALEAYGIDQVNWITLGDSKTDWGLDHQAIRVAQSRHDIDHLRMSLGGTSFMSIQAATQWSMENLPNLDGFLLGIYEKEFLNWGDFKKEFKIAWPYRAHIDHQNFRYFRHLSPWQRFLGATSVHNYWPDLKQFLNSPGDRLARLERTPDDLLTVFDYRHDSPSSLCEHQLDSLESCVNSFKHINNIRQLHRNYHLPYLNCRTPRAKNRLARGQQKPRQQDLAEFQDQWTRLFDSILSADKQLTLLLMPEHTFFEYMRKPANSDELIDHLLNRFADEPGFKVIDLRNLFYGPDECSHYSDVLHFNNQGIEVVTRAVIDQL